MTEEHEQPFIFESEHVSDYDKNIKKTKNQNFLIYGWEK